MPSFNRLLDADFHPPKTWVLNLSLTYDTNSLNENNIAILKGVGVKISNNAKITIPKNFDTDLASVPRILWWFISPFDVARPAALHDYLYRCIRTYVETHQNYDMSLVFETKNLADNLFKEAMTLSDMSRWKQWCAWKAVDLFGHLSLFPKGTTY